MKKGFLVLLVMVLAAATLGWADEGKKWQGFYIGINTGLARHEPNWSDNDYDWFGGTLTNPYHTILGGGTIGFNVQNGSLVMGFEFDGAFGFMENEIKYEMDPTPPPATWDVTKTDKLELLITMRFRAGFALENALFYLTAGAGMPIAAHTWIEAGDVPDSWKTFKNSNTGMAVGLGFEYRLGQVVSIKAEFLGIKNPPKTQANAKTVPYHMSVDEAVGILRIGFNIHF